MFVNNEDEEKDMHFHKKPVAPKDDDTTDEDQSRVNSRKTDDTLDLDTLLEQSDEAANQNPDVTSE